MYIGKRFRCQEETYKIHNRLQENINPIRNNFEKVTFNNITNLVYLDRRTQILNQ